MCQEVSVRACNDTNPTFGARKDEQSHVKNATEATYSSVKLMQPRRAETPRVLAGKSQRDERRCCGVYQFSDYNETTSRSRVLLFFPLSLSFRKKKRHISIAILFNAFFQMHLHVISLGSRFIYFLCAYARFSRILFATSNQVSEKLCYEYI